MSTACVVGAFADWLWHIPKLFSHRRLPNRARRCENKFGKAASPPAAAAAAATVAPVATPPVATAAAAASHGSLPVQTF